MPPITSPLDGSLFRFEVGHGPGTLITRCKYLPLGIASSDFDARDSGYRSKFTLHVARQLLDDPAALDRALRSVEKLDGIVEVFIAGTSADTVSALAELATKRNPDALMFFLAHAMKENLAPPPELYALTWIWGDRLLRPALDEYLESAHGRTAQNEG